MAVPTLTALTSEPVTWGVKSCMVKDGKMNNCQTVLNLANAIMDRCVLAIPYAFRLANFWAVPLLFLVSGITMFTAVLIGDELKMARCEALDGSTPVKCRDLTHLAEISFGRCGNGVVAFLILLEVWVQCITRLVLCGDRLRTVFHMGQSQAVLVCLLISTFMMFIPLRLYAYVSLASLAALLMAGSCYLGEIFTIPPSDWSVPDMQWTPNLADLFRAYGLFMFGFAGHACLPVFHERMQNTQRWNGCVSWAFSLTVLFYLAVGLLSLLKGDAAYPVFVDGMSTSLKDLAVALLTVKIQAGTPFLLRVVLLSLQIWPSNGTVADFVPVGLVLCLTAAAACLMANQLAAIATLTGALLMNCTCLMIPCWMYMKLSLRCMEWSQQPRVNKVKIIASGALVPVGLIAAAGTYWTLLVGL